MLDKRENLSVPIHYVVTLRRACGCSRIVAGSIGSFKQRDQARPGRYRHYPESEARLRPGISLPKDAVSYIPLVAWGKSAHDPKADFLALLRPGACNFCEQEKRSSALRL